MCVKPSSDAWKWELIKQYGDGGNGSGNSEEAQMEVMKYNIV